MSYTKSLATFSVLALSAAAAWGSASGGANETTGTEAGATTGMKDMEGMNGMEMPQEPVVFRHALTGEPLDFKYRTDQTITMQVEAFKMTGTNPYSDDPEAIAAGQKSYNKLCASCHMKDGSGRIGPSLNDDDWKRARTDTEVGRFEIIYGGGAGAMQPFGRRIDQDEILKIMAYIDTFRQ